MSRLSEILGVKEGQEFRYGNQQRSYKVVDEHFYMKKDSQDWWNNYTNKFIDMIVHPELIHPIPEPQLTEQQITAIKGRIAEGTPWAARAMNKKPYFCFYKEKPKLSAGKTYYTCLDDTYSDCFSDIYDFITFENSPVYLPELVEGSEDK